MIPENLKYTKQHEWVKIENDEAVFGITDYAQSELGDITFVEMPEKTEAEAAISGLNGKELKGREIVVNEARPRQEGSRGGRGKPSRGGRSRW